MAAYEKHEGPCANRQSGSHHVQKRGHILRQRARSPTNHLFSARILDIPQGREGERARNLGVGRPWQFGSLADSQGRGTLSETGYDNL